MINLNTCLRSFDGVYHHKVTKKVEETIDIYDNAELVINVDDIDLLCLNNQFDIKIKTLTIETTNTIKDNFTLDILKGIKVKTLIIKMVDSHVIISSDRPIPKIIIDGHLNILEGLDIRTLYLKSSINILYGLVWRIETDIFVNDVCNHINHLVIIDQNKRPNISPNVSIIHFYGDTWESPDSFIYGSMCVDGELCLDLSEHISIYRTPLKDLIGYVL